MTFTEAIKAMRSDPWFQRENAEALRKMREIEEFAAECAKRYPVEGCVYGMSATGMRPWRSQVEDDSE